MHNPAMLSEFAKLTYWLRAQKKPESQYVFESPTNCLLAQYFKANYTTENPPPRFEGGNWSSIFPGLTYEDRLRCYHRIGDAKPFTYAGALKRLEAEAAKWSYA